MIDKEDVKLENLDRLFKVNSVLDVIKAYPEQVFEMLQELFDKHELAKETIVMAYQQAILGGNISVAKITKGFIVREKLNAGDLLKPLDNEDRYKMALEAIMEVEHAPKALRIAEKALGLR